MLQLVSVWSQFLCIYMRIRAAMSIKMDLHLFVVFFVFWMANLALRKRHIAERKLRERNIQDLMRRRRQRSRRQVHCNNGEETLVPARRSRIPSPCARFIVHAYIKST